LEGRKRCGSTNDASVHGCADDDLGGGYIASEKTMAASPLIVVIDLEVGGKRVHTRWFQNGLDESETKDLDGRAQWNEHANRAVQNATAKVIENLRKALADSAVQPS